MTARIEIRQRQARLITTLGSALGQLQKESNRMTTHLEHRAKAKRATPCGAHHAKIGGGCANCGWVPATIGTRVKVKDKNHSGVITRVRTQPGKSTTFLFVPDDATVGRDGWWLHEDEFES
jgi:hypothetical protein